MYAHTITCTCTGVPSSLSYPALLHCLPDVLHSDGSLNNFVRSLEKKITLSVNTNMQPHTFMHMCVHEHVYFAAPSFLPLPPPSPPSPPYPTGSKFEQGHTSYSRQNGPSKWRSSYLRL